MPEPNGYGLVSTNWALGSLILVGLASSELTGGATVVALPIAALASTLAAACAPPPPPNPTTRKRRFSDLAEFLEIWHGVLELLAATATCARIASATIDYMSKGRFRDWLFGIESHSLGEPWPDVLGVTIMIVATGLFMLGLDKSPSLCLLLYLGLGGSFGFFVVTGSFYTDTKFWSWTHDFNMRDWESILTASALCAAAFSSTAPEAETKLCLNYALLAVVPLVAYTTLVLVFTLMSHFRELSGTAIPLVRVFEMRDVEWARPVMATCTIFVACVALTELMPALYAKVMRLAGREWRVLVSSLTYRNPFSGAPVLAIFTAGSLAAILAFACPLSYLVRLLNAAVLIKCALRCSRALHLRYRVETPVHEDLSVQHTNIQYSRLSKSVKRPSPLRRIKTSLDMVPRFLRGSAKGDDQECLLMDSYTKGPGDRFDEEEEPESNSEESAPEEGEEESMSSTDIDAVVQEYKDQIQVTTVSTFGDPKGPTRLTSRTVAALTCLVYVSASLSATGVLLHEYRYVWPGCLGVAGVLAVLPFFPSNRPGFLVPCAATLGAAISTALAALLLVEIWFGIVMWTFAGLVLFCRCDCCNCEGLYPTRRERQRLYQAKGDCPTFSGEQLVAAR